MDILIRFEDYGKWNPFIVQLDGKPVTGTRLRNVMLLGEKKQTFRPVVTEVVERQRFEWLGKGLLGMFTGRHYFELKDSPNGQTKLIHGEHFGGWLRKPIMNRIGEQTRNSFIEMNRALKEEVEKQAKTAQN